MKVGSLAGLILVIMLTISGCGVHTVVVPIDSGKAACEPTGNVTILFEEPNRPYKAIALIEGNGGRIYSQAQILQALQTKAQAIGAHAIITIATDSEYVPTFRMTNFDGSLLTIPGGHNKSAKVLAIRYTSDMGR